MSTNDMIMPLARTDELPVVRTIGFHDLRQALAQGLADFKAMPTHVVFLSLIYPIVGVLLWFATAGLDLLALLYPLATGFALLGPFAAIGLYELSRRREMHLDTSWQHAFDVRHSASLGPILLLGLLLVVVFLIWIAVAHGIYVANFGIHEPESPGAFISKVLTTSAGHNLIVVGNLVGAAFALFVFVISVVSFPLLLERDVGGGGCRDHIHQGSCRQSACDDVLGRDHRRRIADRLIAAAGGTGRRDADPRPCELASLSARHRATRVLTLGRGGPEPGV
jgi:uncharacterized membrane protein